MIDSCGTVHSLGMISLGRRTEPGVKLVLEWLNTFTNLLVRSGVALLYVTCSLTFLAVIVVHLTQADPCSDLDPHGCAANPDLCLDDVLAIVTCPVTCHRCRKCLNRKLILQYILFALFVKTKMIFHMLHV